MLKKDLVLAFGLSGGCLNNKQIFFDGSKLAKTRNNLFDGFKILCSGVLFATGLGSVLVIDKDRKYLGTIMPCKKTAKCGFDSEEKYLYITCSNVLEIIKLKDQ